MTAWKDDSIQAAREAADVLAAASDVGVATDALIGHLAARFGVLTPEQVLRIGRAALVGPRLALPNRQAMRAQVLSRTAVYFREFARTGWRFAGREVIVGHAVALDLLWERAGVLEADAIETGRLRPADVERLRRQVEGQLYAGKRAYGDSFAAVRAVVLTRPQTSFEVRA